MHTDNDSLIARIAANPNPRSFRGRVIAFICWGRNIDRGRAFEAARTTFGVLGAAGYAGYLASMHVVMASLSVALVGATWYGVYTMTVNR